MFKKVMDKLVGGPGPVQERRSALRVPCKVAVKVQYAQADQDGHVTDISLKGLRLHLLQGVAKGQSVVVRVSESPLGAAACKVLWASPSPNGGFLVGLRLVDSKEMLSRSWLWEKFYQLGFRPDEARERRTYIRFPAPPVAALMMGDEDVATRGMLLNISYGGALVEASADLVPDSVVRFTMEATADTPELNVMALVRSCFYNEEGDFHTAGLEFSKPGLGAVRKYIRAVKKKLSG